MKEKEKHLDRNEATREGLKEIIIREGAARKLLDEKEPIKISLVGDINAPTEFIKHRASLHKKEEAHVLFDRDGGKIILILDEKDHNGAKVEGKLTMDSEVAALGINSEKMLGHKELLSLMKFTKHLFKEPAKHTALMNELKMLKVKLEAEFMDKNDGKGNQNTSLTLSAKTNIKLEFNLHAPIYKGFGKRAFKVDILFEAHSASNIQFWLESEEYQQLVVAEKNSIFDEKKDALKEYVIIEK